MATNIFAGSTNAVKLEATKVDFQNYFSNVIVCGVEVSSDVSDQPHNDETFKGAENLAINSKFKSETRKS